MSNEEYLRSLLTEALPFLQGYDLMGTGGLVSKKEYEAMNQLEKKIAEAVGDDPDDYGYHSEGG